MKFAVRLKTYLPLLGMLAFPFLGWIYTQVDHPGKRVYSMMTDLDKAIPLVKAFILPYSLWIVYIYMCMIYFFIRDPKLYIRCLAAYVTCTLLCYGIFLVFQTTVPRPPLTGTDPITHLLAFVYRHDQPFNCFPSIHCMSSYLVMKGLYTSRFRNRTDQTLIYGLSSLIILSTLFVKQHTIMDVVAGVAMAELVYRMISALQRRSSETRSASTAAG